MFINESFANFLFSRVERVDFGNLWNKRVLEFDGAIEGSMRGENVISLLREDICKVGAEVRDRDLLRLISLGELCQDGDLVDLFF